MILKNEFNLITIENDMKFSKIHPQRNTYDFLIPDLMVEFAEKNNMKVRGHALVWHHDIPDWLLEKELFKGRAFFNIKESHSNGC